MGVKVHGNEQAVASRMEAIDPSAMPSQRLPYHVGASSTWDPQGEFADRVERREHGRSATRGAMSSKEG